MGPDIDDAVALAMLHGYQDAGKIEIAAVTVSRGSDTAAKYIDAVNTKYGRPNIPIGIYRGGTVSAVQVNNDQFTNVADEYSHDVAQSPIPDSYKLIRKVLANAAGRRVLVIQTGFSGSLSSLMDSGADAYSSLNGRDLVNATVDKLYMAGARFDSSGEPEFNIKFDVSSARNLFRKWPKDIVVMGWEVGAKLLYPYDRGIKAKYPDKNHPVRRAYEYPEQPLSWHISLDRNPPPEHYNMASWDLTPIMQAIEPEKNYFKYGVRGDVTIGSNIVTTITPNSAGKFIMYKVPDNRARTINRMVEVVK